MNKIIVGNVFITKIKRDYRRRYNFISMDADVVSLGLYYKDMIDGISKL